MLIRRTVGGDGEAPLTILIDPQLMRDYLDNRRTEMEPHGRLIYRGDGKYTYTDFYCGFVNGMRTLVNSLLLVGDVPSLFRVETGIARRNFHLRAEAIFSPPRRIDPDPFARGFDHAFNTVFDQDQWTRGHATALAESWEPIIGVPYRPERIRDFLRFLLTVDLAQGV